MPPGKLVVADIVSGSFLMTYDNDQSVRELAQSYSFDFEPIAMKGTHHTEMSELLIGRDLHWVRV